MTHAHAGRRTRLAEVVVVEARHDLEQAALAGTVCAEHADLRTREERERDALEDHAVDADHLADILHRVDELVRHNRSMSAGRPLDGLRSPTARGAKLAAGAYSIGLAVALLATAAARAAPAHPEVLVVVNDASKTSVAIGEAYLRLRGVPAQNLVHLQVPLGDDAALATPAHERIDRTGYTARVRDPIARFLRQNDPGGRIRILVTTKGVPMRVEDDEPGVRPDQRRTAAVDAELAVLFSPLEGHAGIAGAA